MPLEEFEFGNSRAILVGVDGDAMTIRSEGRNLAYAAPKKSRRACLRTS